MYNLVYTEAELAVWKDREANGPYRITGDVNSKSPNDATRIASTAATFLNLFNTSQWIGRYRPDNDSAPILQSNEDGFNINTCPNSNHKEMVHAAMYYTLDKANRSNYGQIVANEIVGQAQEARTDWTNATRWPLNHYDVGAYPQLIIAWWLDRILFCHELVYELYTAPQRAIVDAWFIAGATYWGYLQWNERSNLFTDRLNFIRSAADDYNWNGTSYMYRHYSNGQWIAPDLNQTTHLYHNSQQSSVAFMGIVGMMYDIPDLIDKAKQLFKEQVNYTVTHDNFMTEMNRTSTIRQPYFYPLGGAIKYWHFADAHARWGLQKSLSNWNEMYEYTSVAGNDDCIGTGRTLWEACKTHLKMKRGELIVYNYLKNGQTDWIVDGKDDLTNIESITEMNLLRANMYYRDPIVSEHLRNCTNTNYTIASNGAFSAFDGDAGGLQTMFLMHGQMENNPANPYISINIEPVVPITNDWIDDSIVMRKTLFN